MWQTDLRVCSKLEAFHLPTLHWEPELLPSARDLRKSCWRVHRLFAIILFQFHGLVAIFNYGTVKLFLDFFQYNIFSLFFFYFLPLYRSLWLCMSKNSDYLWHPMASHLCLLGQFQCILFLLFIKRSRTEFP